MTLTEQLIATIRDVPDFPKPGILFKDITPVLANPKLSERVSHAFFEHWRDKDIQGIVGIESRGFIYGMKLAQELQVPFIPVRKAGKLPYDTVKFSYALEYGKSEMEIHVDAINRGQNILVHDDLLATGGTAAAAAELIKMCKGKVAGFSFMVELSFLKGRKKLNGSHSDIQTLVKY